MLVTINLNIITLVEELPKTKLLYWDQQYQKTCDSEIIKMVQEKNEVYIILDKTIITNTVNNKFLFFILKAAVNQQILE